MKLFSLKSKQFKDDRELRSLGNAPFDSLQSRKFNIFKEDKFTKERSCKHLVGDDHKEKTTFFLLHSANENTSWFIK